MRSRRHAKEQTAGVLKVRESENARLERLVADTQLDQAILQDPCEKLEA